MTRYFVVLSVLLLVVAACAYGQTPVATLNEDAFAAFDGFGSGGIDTLPPSPAEKRDVQQNVRDIHFDFDRAGFTDGRSIDSPIRCAMAESPSGCGGHD